MTKLREAITAVDATNDRVGAAVRVGDPGLQILRFAQSLPADLIVMGTGGAERPERPPGPVTATVVSRSDCPVLIVRPIERPTRMIQAFSRGSSAPWISRRPPPVSFATRCLWLEKQVHTPHSCPS
jgi:hypothetical protein